MTAQTPDRRWVARFTVPRHLTEPDIELRRVRLLDLSAKGARIEHLEHLHEGLVRSVDLPPILGGLRLTGQVVWTRLHKREHTYEGDTRVSYQSGLAFVRILPEQQEVLAGALTRLETGDAPDRGRGLATMLRQFREQRRMTQAQLAERAGTTQEYVAMIESGARKNPSLELLKQLAEALQVKVGELLR